MSTNTIWQSISERTTKCWNWVRRYGVFTKILTGYTPNLVVTDLSPVQLSLNEQRAQEGKYVHRIKEWIVADICDLSRYGDRSFDKVVCYGGPLSYVFERKGDALLEMKRVLKPGGITLISVINLWGTVRESLKKIIQSITPEENEKVIADGNLHPSSFAPSDHHCHMFTAEELQKDIQKAGFALLEISASNCLSVLRAEELAELQKDQQKWPYFFGSGDPGLPCSRND